MKAIRRHGTRPELLVRRFLSSHGIRYRCNGRGLPGSPDLVNRTKGWAVFVHGCFWHGHQGCPRATTPKRNRAFWIAKIQANKRRDAKKEAALRRAGLSVRIVWECDALNLAKAPVSEPPAALLTLLLRLKNQEATPPRARRRPTGTADGSSRRRS